jgi:hypothetical protein
VWRVVLADEVDERVEVCECGCREGEGRGRGGGGGGVQVHRVEGLEMVCEGYYAITDQVGPAFVQQCTILHHAIVFCKGFY